MKKPDHLHGTLDALILKALSIQPRHGYAVARWLDPLQPERTDHMIAAIVCIVLTALSIVASVLTARVF